MKNIFSILLISVLLFSCSKDRVRPTTLDADLFGNWKEDLGSNNTGLNSYDYYLTLSSNGKFVYYIEYSNNPQHSYSTGNSGEWWVEGNNLALTGDGFGMTDKYSVSENSLNWGGMSWNR